MTAVLFAHNFISWRLLLSLKFVLSVSVCLPCQQVTESGVEVLAQFLELFWAPTSLPPQETKICVPGKLLNAVCKCDSELYKLLQEELPFKRTVASSVNLRHSVRCDDYKTLNI